MRVHSKWSHKGKVRSVDEITGALSFILWRIAQQLVLNLENEGYQTDSNRQRLLVMREVIAFTVHLVDRLTYESFNQAQREQFITQLAKHLAKHDHDNMRDLTGDDPQDISFLDTLNTRMADFAEFEFKDKQPDFGMRRLLGENVSAQMGPAHNKWITAQVMEVEAPEALETLQKAMRNLMPNPVAVYTDIESSGGTPAS